MENFWSITISDIIAIVALIAAVWAAWAATKSNKNAEKSMEEARTQFQENMREQNRAINVSLLDQRTETLTSIENNSFSFNRTRAKLLFNDSITDTIAAYDKVKREEKRIEDLKKEYMSVVESSSANDSWDADVSWLRIIDDYSNTEPDSPLYGQLRGYLLGHGILGKWLHGTDPLKEEMINYVELDDAAAECRAKAEAIKSDLIAKIKSFIETSIQ